MTRIDRYVTGIFIGVFLVAQISLTGVFVMADLVGHLTEFLEAGEGAGGVVDVVLEFYGARTPWLFDLLGRVVALLAAAYTVTLLERHNEMTALLAAGIPRHRILRPLIACTVVVVVMAAVNRETVIPMLRAKLCRGTRDVTGMDRKPVQPLRDYRSDILFGGRYTIAAERRIHQPNFRLPSYLSRFGTRLLAEDAHYLDATAQHPSGYLLSQVREPENIGTLESAELDGRPVILTQLDAAWLEPDQCFVATDIRFEQLEAGSKWKQFASTWELIQGLRDPSLDYGADVRLTVHARLVQPVLDVVLLFLGLPSVLSRNSRNVFVSIGHCLTIVSLYFVVIALTHTLGLNLLLSPALAAWLPLMIFVPTAVLVSEPLRH